jgi:hypothetical protein
MKTITSQDKGKRYFLDDKRELEVQLVDALPENAGFVKVKFATGQLLNVEERRLTEITELPERVSDADEVALEYPQKVSKLTIEIFDAETGEEFTKWLEGSEAQKWNDWMRELCYKAEQVGMNPKWLTLKWQGKKTTKAK